MTSADRPEPTPANVPIEPAWRSLAAHLRIWPLSALTLAADLWTKHWAFTRLDPNPDPDAAWVVIPHLMSFRRSLNTGALFGMGKGWTPLFIAASILALGFVLFLFVQSGRHRRSLHVALALVLAGALGNLYDRAFMIADVVTIQASGESRTHLEAYRRLPEQDTPRAIVVGTWPAGEHPRSLPRSLVAREHQQGVVRDFIKMEPRFTLAGRQIEIWPWVFNIADALLVIGVALLMLNFWWDRKAEQAAARAQQAGPSSQAATQPAR